ncbi:hypothetical protein K0M31_012027 [Melipona bicolor]|uniref:Uncharacterized protein n=1 Tax=Melipona bicolor TaxID=60889 RepID=A0AA40GAQ4_9HYME|nr:hypothetical protein K0M31_012027 [Melipona bicolor]
MTENERHVEPEVTDLSSDSAEHRVSLYPITMENKRHVEDSTESVVHDLTKKEMHTPENRAQRLQQTQSLPQLLHSTDTQDR